MLELELAGKTKIYAATWKIFREINLHLIF